MTTFSSNPILQRTFFLRTAVDRLLTAGIFFSCFLVLLRILQTGHLLFAFMVWNLFLAYIPYAISNWLSASPQRLQQPFFKYAIFTVWLLFLPNSFYILTDLYHLHNYHHAHVPEWFDLALIFSGAWNGLLLGILSLRQMERLYRPKNASFLDWRFITPIMALNAFGVYIGRYLRYNSWDIISNPFHLAAGIANMIIHPLRNYAAWDMILCFTVLLTLIYIMMKNIGRALN